MVGMLPSNIKVSAFAYEILYSSTKGCNHKSFLVTSHKAKNSASVDESVTLFCFLDAHAKVAEYPYPRIPMG